MSKIVQFLREVKQEFHHITWPKKESLFELTFVVISISILISLILGGFDYIFTQSINLIGRQPQIEVSPQTETTPEASPSAFEIVPTISTAPTPIKK